MDKDLAKGRYKELFHRVSKLLFEADPVGVNFETNTDEYDPEAETIIPRLRFAQSAADVHTIVYEEFCDWFGESAGEKEAYAAVSEKIWAIWRERRSELN